MTLLIGDYCLPIEILKWVVSIEVSIEVVRRPHGPFWALAVKGLYISKV
jgi:hypothetical protein